MDCYKIITDEEALIKFIEWLPDLKDNETFYLSLFCRKKYAPEAGMVKSNDKTQLKRFTANKENMIDKIRQLEIPLGYYKLKDVVAPQEALVLYIMPNPRCMKKATELMGKKCWDLIRSENYNLHQEAMSCIQQSKSYGFVVDFDIDTKDVDLTKLNDIFFPIASSQFKNKPFDIVETRGGYHVLIQPNYATAYLKAINSFGGHQVDINWYKRITEICPVDQSSDQMLPVVGTFQGGFVPKFITI